MDHTSELPTHIPCTNTTASEYAAARSCLLVSLLPGTFSLFVLEDWPRYIILFVLCAHTHGYCFFSGGQQLGVTRPFVPANGLRRLHKEVVSRERRFYLVLLRSYSKHPRMLRPITSLFRAGLADNSRERRKKLSRACVARRWEISITDMRTEVKIYRIQSVSLFSCSERELTKIFSLR